MIIENLYPKWVKKLSYHKIYCLRHKDYNGIARLRKILQFITKFPKKFTYNFQLVIFPLEPVTQNPDQEAYNYFCSQLCLNIPRRL